MRLEAGTLSLGQKDTGVENREGEKELSSENVCVCNTEQLNDTLSGWFGDQYEEWFRMMSKKQNPDFSLR